MLSANLINWILNAKGVLLLFLIPIGGGIPAGVILAQEKGIGWPLISLLYLISDIILACIFESIISVVVVLGRDSQFLTRWILAFKKSMDLMTLKYGVNPSPLTLIIISFVADPMTGRTLALAAGHNFFSGWSLAIAGDMIFFGILMASTLWLNNILGNGTWATIIVTGLVIAIHFLVRSFRERRSRSQS